MGDLEIIEKMLVGIGGGVGGMLLTLAAYWQRIMTRKQHAAECGIGEVLETLDEAITKDELDNALQASTKETDLKLEAIKTSVGSVDAKLTLVVSFLMGKPQPPNKGQGIL